MALTLVAGCAPDPTAPPAVAHLDPPTPAVAPVVKNQPAPARSPPVSDVYRLDDRIVRPRLLRQVMLDRRRISGLRPTGIPVLETIIGKDGRVQSVRISHSSGDSSLDASMVDAVRQWQFEPATLNGKPVSVYFVVTMNIDWQ